MVLEGGGPSPVRPIAIVLFDDQQELQLYVLPEYRNFVEIEDIGYLDELFRDLVKRASTDAASIFMQVSSLSVGPLITEATGDKLIHYPELIKETLDFAAFEVQDREQGPSR